MSDFSYHVEDDGGVTRSQHSDKASALRAVRKLVPKNHPGYGYGVSRVRHDGYITHRWTHKGEEQEWSDHHGTWVDKDMALDEVFDKTPKGREKLKKYFKSAIDDVANMQHRVGQYDAMRDYEGLNDDSKADLAWHAKTARNRSIGLKRVIKNKLEEETMDNDLSLLGLMNAVEGNLEEMMQNFSDRLSQKAAEALEEKKSELAYTIFK
jgi:hypothetical protein